MSDKIKLSVEVNPEDLWSEVLGGGWEEWIWWIKINYLDGADWDKIGKVEITYEDPDEEGKHSKKIIGIEDLVRAIEFAVSKGYRDACTGIPIKYQDVEAGFDACSSDCIVQIAVMGDVYYG